MTYARITAERIIDSFGGINAQQLVGCLLHEVLGLMPQGSGAAKHDYGEDNYTRSFSLKDASGKSWQFVVEFFRYPEGSRRWSMGFYTHDGDGKGMYDKQDNGLEMQVMTMVAQICREFVAQKSPVALRFTASEDHSATDPRKVDNRARLYNVMCKRLCKETGSTYTAEKGGGDTVFSVEFPQ